MGGTVLQVIPDFPLFRDRGHTTPVSFQHRVQGAEWQSSRNSPGFRSLNRSAHLRVFGVGLLVAGDVLRGRSSPRTYPVAIVS